MITSLLMACAHSHPSLRLVYLRQMLIGFLVAVGVLIPLPATLSRSFRCIPVMIHSLFLRKRASPAPASLPLGSASALGSFSRQCFLLAKKGFFAPPPPAAPLREHRPLVCV